MGSPCCLCVRVCMSSRTAARQRLGKHVLAAMSTHAVIGELVPRTQYVVKGK
jgi:hypothetical protein